MTGQHAVKMQSDLDKMSIAFLGRICKISDLGNQSQWFQNQINSIMNAMFQNCISILSKNLFIIPFQNDSIINHKKNPAFCQNPVESLSDTIYNTDRNNCFL